MKESQPQGRRDMRFEASVTLEEQIKSLATELERTRSDLRALQRQHRRSALSTRLFYLSGLIVIVSLAGIAFSPPGAAQQQVARPTTYFDAPFVVYDKNHRPIVEISDEPGKKGLTVYGPPEEASGSSVRLGFGKSAAGDIGGVILLKDTSNHAFARIDPGGYVFLGKSDTSVATMGRYDGKGVVAIFNQAGKVVAFLTEKDNHGGSVTVADPAGEGVFSAGFTGDGGNACISNTKRGIKCVGIGLPMTMQVGK